MSASRFRRTVAGRLECDLPNAAEDHQDQNSQEKIRPKKQNGPVNLGSPGHRCCQILLDYPVSLTQGFDGGSAGAALAASGDLESIALAFVGFGTSLVL
jgi:hypothetical protein